MIKENKLPQLLAISLFAIFLFSCSHASNYKKAYIKAEKNVATITLYGKRVGMVHSLSDLFKDNTYPVSIKLELPNRTGNIEPKEVIAPNTYFKFIKGNVSLTDKNISIDLYSSDPGYPENDPFAWNGTYELERRK